MSNLQQYTKALVYLNGRLLSEEASVTVRRMSNAQDVETVAKGFAGQSPGAARAEISVSNAVPSADFELDPGSFIENLEDVELTVFAAGRTGTTKGFITDDNFTHAVNSAAKLDFNFKGQYFQWT